MVRNLVFVAVHISIVHVGCSAALGINIGQAYRNLCLDSEVIYGFAAKLVS